VLDADLASDVYIPDWKFVPFNALSTLDTMLVSQQFQVCTIALILFRAGSL
jgi:hypothetical protein